MGRKALIHELVKGGLISSATATALTVAPHATLGLEITPGSAVADATGGATIDAEARTAINDLLAELRTAGIIVT